MLKSTMNLPILCIALLAILIAGCSDEAPPVPTSAAVSAETPAAIATPISLETVEAYVQGCRAAFSSQLTGGVEDLSWGMFTELLDGSLAAIARFRPQREIQAYHEANLGVMQALHDHARARDSERSFAAEYIGVYFVIIGAAREIDTDVTKTPQEKERLLKELEREKFGKLFGPAYVTANEALEEAKSALSEDVAALLGANCEIFGAGAGDQEPETTLLGSFAAGERARIGDYEVNVTRANRIYKSLEVGVIVRNIGSIPVSAPTCRDWMSLHDHAGERYSDGGCRRRGSGGDLDSIAQGETITIIVSYRGIPESAVGVTLRFSDGTSRVDFDLSPLLALTAETDREALVAFYNATGGDNWSDNTNWLSDKPIGEWRGVTTNRSGRVTQLILHGNRLSGPLPSVLSNVTNLEVLELSGNQLTGEIPRELGSLANLEFLSLQGNQLGGTIPTELGSPTNLEDLWLSDNRLSGCIPNGLRDVEDNDFYSLGLPYCGE